MPQKRKVPSMKTIEVSPYRRTYTLTEKMCPVCGKTFTGTVRARYDTVACRQKANYDRHASDYRQQKLEKYHATKTASRSAGKK